MSLFRSSDGFFRKLRALPPEPEIGEDLTLDAEQTAALAVMKTSRATLLTGPAGTGKSRTVKALIRDCRRERKGVIVTGFTGVAAMLLPGGMTLHSAVRLPVVASHLDDDGRQRHRAWLASEDLRDFLDHGEDFTVNEKGESVVAWSKLASRSRANLNDFVVKRLRAASYLIVDETSMIDRWCFDAASYLVACAREKDEPFGGLKVIMVGDLGQLPPVDEKRWGWAVDSAAYEAMDPTVVNLTQIHRQDDPRFTALLGRLRIGSLNQEDARVLLGRVNVWDPRTAVRIFATNKECDRVNAAELARLDSPLVVLHAKDWVSDEKLRFLVERFDKGYSAARKLELKIGARVLMTINDPLEKPIRFANGTAGHVVAFDVPPHGLSERGREALQEQHPGSLDLETLAEDGPELLGISVRLDSGALVWVGRHAFEIDEGGSTLASRTQYPLRLGWGITAHRSQGATLERASVNLSRGFAEGQAYTALSRVKSLDGLNLESPKLGKVAAHKRFLEFEAERKRIADGWPF